MHSERAHSRKQNGETNSASRSTGFPAAFNHTTIHPDIIPAPRSTGRFFLSANSPTISPPPAKWDDSPGQRKHFHRIIFRTGFLPHLAAVQSNLVYPRHQCIFNPGNTQPTHRENFPQTSRRVYPASAPPASTYNALKLARPQTPEIFLRTSGENPIPNGRDFPGGFFFFAGDSTGSAAVAE